MWINRSVGARGSGRSVIPLSLDRSSESTAAVPAIGMFADAARRASRRPHGLVRITARPLHRNRAMNPSDLRRRRLRIGLSREQLAHAVGVSPIVLRAWEDGTAPVAYPRA